MPLYMPQMYKKETSRSMTANFYGLNHNLKIADGEWFDMENLKNEGSSVIETRAPRYKLDIPEYQSGRSFMVRPAGKNGEPEPVWVDQTGKVFFGRRTSEDMSEELGFVGTLKFEMTSIGAYVIIKTPDIAYINAESPSDEGQKGSIRRRQVYSGEGSGAEYIKIDVCDYDGVKATYVQYNQPGRMDESQPKNGDTWHYTHEEFPELLRYDAETNNWYEIQSYLKFTRIREEAEVSFEIPGGIKPGDVLDVSVDYDLHNLDAYLEFKKIVGNRYVQGVKENSFWIDGVINRSQLRINITEEETVSIGHAVPDMDYIIESGNRLWGCKFGKVYNNATQKEEPINEVYCSARGDFFRWIAGPSDNDDSPVTFSIGADGAFTGAIDYRGTPIFFKENKIIQIKGFGASGFALSEEDAIGMAAGDSKSLQVVENALYYKGGGSIYRYDGSVPITVSDKLGDIRDWVVHDSGRLGKKYCINATSYSGKEEKTQLYIMDAETGIWTAENEITNGCYSTADNLYYLGEDGFYAARDLTAGAKKTVGSEDKNKINYEKDRNSIRWYAESGIIGLETPDEKYITKLAIRLKLEAGAHVRVLIQYDSSGEWEQVMAAEFVGMRTVTVPVHPHKYDHMRYRLEGEGDCQIFSVTKTLERAGRR